MGVAGVASALTALALLVPASSAPAQEKAGASDGYAQRFASECATCHGADGRSETPGTPNLAGQHSYYAVTQLFLFREGRRSNAEMTAVGKAMKDDDLRGFSDFIGTLAPLPASPPGAPLDTARMSRGKALAEQHKCLFCHGPDLSGGQQVPRIAGQREEYLRESLNGYRTRKRVGYTPAMLEPLSTLSAEDVDVLAYFAAHLPETAKASPGK